MIPKIVIAVASCKGGVGKSTVAVMVARALARMGLQVALLDADVYGPSLPTLVPSVERVAYLGPENTIIPIEAGGIQCMSFGYLTNETEESPAMLRGPMVSQIVKQMVTTTAWQDRDVLVIDLPPGTGDIQLAIAQMMPISGAIMVTTPHALSVADVRKGILAFNFLKIPTIGLVENMSFWTCPNCPEKSEIFGPSRCEQIQAEFGIPHGIRLPISPGLSTGVWAEMDQVGSDSAAFLAWIESVWKEAVSPPVPTVQVQPDSSGGLQILTEKGYKQVASRALRMACRCALCVDEHTSERRVRASDIPEDIAPIRVNRVGNYAVSIRWSDNHLSLYPDSQLENWN